MKLVISKIFICSLLLVTFSVFPQATAQCPAIDDTPTKIDLWQIQDFHLQLFRELIPNDAKTNFIFSPNSVWNALTLAYIGASGRTEEQLRQVLRHNDKSSALKIWKALENKSRQQDHIGSTYISANRAYFDTKIKLRSCIQNILHNEVEKIDFTKSHEASNQINDFISRTTRGTIKELVFPEDVDRARVVLVNAAYFKGAWNKKFHKRETTPTPFTGLDGTQYSVDMMHQKGRFKFGYDDQLKAKFLELPYTGESTSMLLFLPYKNTQDNFHNMIQGLSKGKFEEALNKMILTDIEVDLPKFKLETTVKEELLQTLTAMGITDAFDSSKAQFDTFTPDRPISLDNSVQKAFIEVNEDGTEASAATGFIGTKAGGTSSFECNRPFMFVIRDNETKNILFMGSYKSSDKLDQSYKPSGEPDRNNNFPAKDRVNIHGEFPPSTINEHNNPTPHNQGGISTGFSQGHISSSPDFSFSNLGQSSGSGPVKNQDRTNPTSHNQGGISNGFSQGHSSSSPDFSFSNLGQSSGSGPVKNQDRINPTPHNQGAISNGFSQGHISSSHDFSFPNLGQSSGSGHINNQDRINPTPHNQGGISNAFSQGHISSSPVPFSNLGQSSGSGHIKNEDRINPNFGPNRGAISETKKTNQGSVQNFEYSPNSDSNKNTDEMFTNGGNVQSGFDHNIESQKEDSKRNPSRGTATSHQQNTSYNRENDGLPRGEGGFITDKSLNVQSFDKKDFQAINFNENSTPIPNSYPRTIEERTQSAVKNTHSLEENDQFSSISLERNVPSLGGSFVQEILVTHVSTRNNDLIRNSQNPDRNTQSFGENRGTNPISNQNIPNFDSTRNFIPDIENLQHPNQYSYIIGGITFVPSNPLNRENNLRPIGEFLQNTFQQFPFYRGHIPGRPAQNDPSFGENGGSLANRRVHL